MPLSLGFDGVRVQYFLISRHIWTWTVESAKDIDLRTGDCSDIGWCFIQECFIAFSQLGGCCERCVVVGGGIGCSSLEDGHSTMVLTANLRAFPPAWAMTDLKLSCHEDDGRSLEEPKNKEPATRPKSAAGRIRMYLRGTLDSCGIILRLSTRSFQA